MASLYEAAREAYGLLGVDTEAALGILARTPISVHCWQGDDVGGFESSSAGDPGGGLAVTGNYPGRARTAEELRADLEKVFSLVPGKHRLNLHAFYLDSGGKKVDRDQIETRHFQGWIDWAKSLGLGMDFNPTCFAHPKAADGFTLAHRDPGIRAFWIEHARRCRTIGADIGRALGSTCMVNVWIPDGYKDLPIDRIAPRKRLIESLDAIFAEQLPEKDEIDAVECKLFGIGSESYVAGSHEFYLGYAVSRQKAVCLDAGHFHPTETLADKISSVLLFVPRLLLHVSRGVRWDSDHVVILDDPTRAVMEELVRGDFLGRTSIGLDYFDASINRVAAWVIGIRATQKPLLLALLEPSKQLREVEANGNLTARLAVLEEAKSLPWGAVWDEFCRRHNVPAGAAWLPEAGVLRGDNRARPRLRRIKLGDRPERSAGIHTMSARDDFGKGPENRPCNLKGGRSAQCAFSSGGGRFPRRMPASRCQRATCEHLSPFCHHHKKDPENPGRETCLKRWWGVGCGGGI